MKIFVNGQTLHCEAGENLYQVLRQGGVRINAPCGGTGTCGKCTVLIDGIGAVKACQYTVTEDIRVQVPSAEGKIAVKGLLRPVEVDHPEPCIAVDIGTTTVVAYLVVNGQIVDTESTLNAQKPYGDDVLSRIKYTMEQADGLETLSMHIREQVRRMAADLCCRNGIQTEKIAIAGNTVMLHIYAGVSPSSIGISPFTPVFTETRLSKGAVLLPSIAGYVGADTVAAILASGMHLSEEVCLLVDIGTNGEIALGNKDGITVCAAAAGPAFEGAQISCGAGGIAGAINSVRFTDGRVRYTTIDNKPPIGICGSGILDAMAELLRTELVDESGYFEDKELIITEEISITAGDIRQIQLAKAAIAAGIHTLLECCSTSLDNVAHCYLAGGFGSYLNKESACAIGLLPKALLNKIEPIGNAAGMGAVLWLLSEKSRMEADDIAHNARYLELSASPVFNMQFTMCMGFEL